MEAGREAGLAAPPRGGRGMRSESEPTPWGFLTGRFRLPAGVTYLVECAGPLQARNHVFQCSS